MTSGPASPPAFARFALMAQDQFLVADERGDIEGPSDGLFRDDTRVLSRFVLRVGGLAPSLLGAGVSRDNVVFRAHATNRPLPMLGEAITPEGVIHVDRMRFLWERRLYERVRLTNYGGSTVRVPLEFLFAADFADIFEVRGLARPRRGRTLPVAAKPDGAVLAYTGLDGITRATGIAFSRAASTLADDRATFDAVLGPCERSDLFVEVGPPPSATPGNDRFRHAAACARVAMRRKRRRGAALRTPTRPFAAWLDKSRADVALLTVELPTGPYPLAGIPWFATPFGRDGIVTALELLWLDDSLARGVLRFLAAEQASAFVPEQDAEPGKILHEVRAGEMAALGEVPFRRYYGSVDSTPLFVVLAGAYARRCADPMLVDALWPHLVAAMRWIDARCERNADGLLAYERARPTGLVNQGWKDSVDAVFHDDGRVPQGPVALVEVQGYVYAARLALAELAERRGQPALAAHCRARAQSLRDTVEAKFWLPERAIYALAVDGEGQPCRVASSNAGQLLWTGLPAPERGARVVEQLRCAAFNDGWGIRTLARGEARYNPMSYHNGSIWPHDTALCAAGMARYGERHAAAQLLNELFDAASSFGARLPELYCGFGRRPGEPPVAYPVACLPQAWSSGAVFLLLEACLGVSIDAGAGRIRIDRPELPAIVDRLVVERLDVAGEQIGLAFERIGGRVAVAPLRCVPGGVQVDVRL